MSLINDMLRDLDTRNAAASERSGLANNIRALPGGPVQRGMNPLLLVLIAAAVSGATVWFLLRPSEPAAQIPAAPVAVASAAVPAVSVPEPAPTVQAPSAPVVAEPVPAPIATTDAPALRLETAIKTEPVPKPAARIEAAAPQPKPVVTPAAAPVAARTKEAPHSNATPQISKQPTDASTSSERADVEYRRGVTALQRGDAVEGSAALRAALQISPTHVPARQALLALFTDQQRWTEAETLALDGVGLLPQRSDWALVAARLMYERGDAANALNVLDRYASAARQNADYQTLRAVLLMRAGRNTDAVECYQTALTLRPNEGRFWYGLGRALDADHREALARQAYEKARDSGNLPPELQQATERRLR